MSGYAVAGGLELALMCDPRVFDEDAVPGVFRQRIGIPLIDGGAVRLPRLSGLSRALALILTGRVVDAREARSFGLANRIVPRGGRGARRATGRVPAGRSALEPSLLDELADALRREGESGYRAELDEGLAGAAHFADGAGRHGGSIERSGSNDGPAD